MASRTKKKPENAAYLDKDPTGVHVDFSDYIERTTGLAVPAEMVGLVQRLYPLYLKTPEVVKARETDRRAREEEAAKREAAKREKLQARLDKIEAQRRKVYTALGLEPDETPAPERFTDGGGLTFGPADSEEEEEADLKVVTLSVSDGLEDDDDDDDEDEEDF